MPRKGRGGRYRPFTNGLFAWIFTAVFCCVFHSPPAFSERIPVWAVFTQENSDLPAMKSWRWRVARTARCGLVPSVVWRGSTRMAAGRPTARRAPRAACRTITSRRWRSARTAHCGLVPSVAWRGSTRMATGRPTARPAPRAACRTITSWRWRVARTARCGSVPSVAWRGSTRMAAGRPIAGRAPRAACRLTTSGRWRVARTARCGSVLLQLRHERWPGAARQGRPLADLQQGEHPGRPAGRSRHGVGGWRGRRTVGWYLRWSGASRQGWPLADLQQGEHPGRPAGRSRRGVGGWRGRRAVGRYLRWSGAARQGWPLADLQQGQHPGRPAGRSRPGVSAGADGALWIGTDGGLAQLDKDGRWQTYSKASTQGGLPDDHVLALAARRGRRAVGRYLRRPGASRQGWPLADLQQGQHPGRPAGR